MALVSGSDGVSEQKRVGSDLEQIRSGLLNLFGSPERWGHEERKLVFWYDPGGEFREVFAGLELPGIQKYEMSHTPFRTKCHLLLNAPKTDFLLYAPYAQPADEDNWLLDLELSGLHFSADRAAMIFRELALYARHLEGYVRGHLTFFSNKKRYAALLEMGLSAQTDEAGLRLAMMSTLAGLRVPNAELLLRGLLMGGLREEENALWCALKAHFSEAEIWDVVEEALSYRSAKASLRQLFIQLSVTHLGRDLRAELPTRLRDSVLPRGAQAYVLVDNWLRHAEDAEAWRALSAEVEHDLGVAALADDLAPEDYAEVETFEAFDRALLRALVSRLLNEGTDYTAVCGLLGRRKTLFWFEHYRSCYAALEAAADFFERLADYADGFEMPAETLFQRYAADISQLDAAYRRYALASERTAALGDLLKGLDERLEAAYTRYLEDLADAWSGALERLDDAPTWGVPGAELQWQFFERKVMPYLVNHEREKVFVIVSDALRYEVAAELRERLLTDLRGEAELSPMLGALPSRTNIGMAALLPGKTLSVDEKGGVLKEGASTQGTEERRKFLGAHPSSGRFAPVVFTAGDLLELSRARGRELTKDTRLVYIYHNVIDKIGENDERAVFAACERALDELQVLMKRIVNSLNGTNVYLVSDHGFLYQRRELGKADKIEVPSKADLFELKRRHALGEDAHAPNSSLGFDLPYLGDTPQPFEKVYAPKGNQRYAIQGAGAQYVHGGASLQEVSVPLLFYKHVRAVKGDDGPSRKVGVQIVTSTRRVTNTLFTLRLLQQEAVGGRVRPRTVSVALYDEAGRAVTNEVSLGLNKTGEALSEREQTVRLTVALSNPDASAVYDLVVRDSDDATEVLREPWSISLAFRDDFGDF